MIYYRFCKNEISFLFIKFRVTVTHTSMHFVYIFIYLKMAKSDETFCNE
jgi:hypothetical protein